MLRMQRGDGRSGARYNARLHRARPRANLRSGLSGLPADLAEHCRLLFRVRLHEHGAVPDVGVGPQCVMCRQSLLQGTRRARPAQEEAAALLRRDKPCLDQSVRALSSPLPTAGILRGRLGHGLIKAQP